MSLKSILKYFKKKNELSLPDPKGSLSASITSAIAAANDEDKALLKEYGSRNGNKHGKRGRYNR